MATWNQKKTQTATVLMTVAITTMVRLPAVKNEDVITAEKATDLKYGLKKYLTGTWKNPLQTNK